MPDFLNTALKEIDTHFREPLTLEYLADKTGISKYHFAREFKRYIGTPPNEYLIITRLNHSKVLLKYKNISVEVNCLCLWLSPGQPILFVMFKNTKAALL